MMASEKYIELLKDPRWQRKRLEKLEQAGWRCEMCFNDKQTLNVHHLRYRRGAMPWEYDAEELNVLCDDCHESVHRAKNELLEIINAAGTYLIQKLHGYAQVAAAIEKERKAVVGNIRTTAGVDGICDALRSPYFPCDPGKIAETIGRSQEANLAEQIILRSAAEEQAIAQFIAEVFPNRVST